MYVESRQGQSDDTPFKAYLKGVATDAFPEMGKRLINGDTTEGKEVINLAFDPHSNTYRMHATSKSTADSIADWLNALADKIPEVDDKK